MDLSKRHGLTAYQEKLNMVLKEISADMCEITRIQLIGALAASLKGSVEKDHKAFARSTEVIDKVLMRYNLYINHSFQHDSFYVDSTDIEATTSPTVLNMIDTLIDGSTTITRIARYINIEDTSVETEWHVNYSTVQDRLPRVSEKYLTLKDEGKLYIHPVVIYKALKVSRGWDNTNKEEYYKLLMEEYIPYKFLKIVETKLKSRLTVGEFPNTAFVNSALTLTIGNQYTGNITTRYVLTLDPNISGYMLEQGDNSSEALTVILENILEIKFHRSGALANLLHVTYNAYNNLDTGEVASKPILERFRTERINTGMYGANLGKFQYLSSIPTILFINNLARHVTGKDYVDRLYIQDYCSHFLGGTLADVLLGDNKSLSNMVISIYTNNFFRGMRPIMESYLIHNTEQRTTDEEINNTDLGALNNSEPLESRSNLLSIARTVIKLSRNDSINYSNEYINNAVSLINLLIFDKTIWLKVIGISIELRSVIEIVEDGKNKISRAFKVGRSEIELMLRDNVMGQLVFLGLGTNLVYKRSGREDSESRKIMATMQLTAPTKLMGQTKTKGYLSFYRDYRYMNDTPLRTPIRMVKRVDNSFTPINDYVSFLSYTINDDGVVLSSRGVEGEIQKTNSFTTKI